MTTNRQQPNKVLAIRILSADGLESWPYEDFPGDPYWIGGSTPKPYRWAITASVSSQAHGDPTTREPFRYNGNDIEPGDWIADITQGKTLKIINIISRTDSSINAVIEDVDRYNTFVDENGAGLFPVPTNCISFSTNDINLPILNPMPGTIVGAKFTNKVHGRFQNNNPLYRYRIVQPGHSVKDNDSIWVDPEDGKFKTALGEHAIGNAVGTVDRVGPGDDVFYFIPSSKIVEGIYPPLPGNAGDLIYINNDGTMTTTPLDEIRISYIQLTNSVSDTSTGTGSTVTQGNVLSINDVNIPFVSNSINDVVAAINSNTDSTNVIASATTADNVASCSKTDLGHGLIAAMGNKVSARINGVTVTFDRTEDGQTAFGFASAIASDMAHSINSANIPNLSAIGKGSSSIELMSSTGGSITIENVSTDNEGLHFAGNSSCSGLPLYTAPSVSSVLSVINPVGNGIIFRNVVGSPVQELGLISASNGALPIGAVAQQSTTIDATPDTSGREIYATKRIPLDTNRVILLTSVLPAGITIENVEVNVLSSNSTAILSIGNATDAEAYMLEYENDPQQVGNYNSELFIITENTTQIIATVSNASASQGEADVKVIYRLP